MEIDKRISSVPEIRAKSVLLGRDCEVIPILLSIHAEKEPKILDWTYNEGKMWKGIRDRYDLTTMDIESKYRTDRVGDFRDMPFPDSSFDVIVFDPPHLPTHAASPGSSKIFEQRYGNTADTGRGRDGDNISPMFAGFLKEAKRVLKENGVVLAKLADIVHNHRYQWHIVDFVNEVRNSGMTPCDLMIKCDPSAGNLKSGKWENVRHLRKGHCYWIVVRNSKHCER
jgi:SAM-dependent methyltransferase